MLTQAENERLTKVGAGEPAGELLRRYWQPVALTEELPADAAPLLKNTIHFLNHPVVSKTLKALL